MPTQPQRHAGFRTPPGPQGQCLWMAPGSRAHSLIPSAPRRRPSRVPLECRQSPRAPPWRTRWACAVAQAAAACVLSSRCSAEVEWGFLPEPGSQTTHSAVGVRGTQAWGLFSEADEQGRVSEGSSSRTQFEEGSRSAVPVRWRVSRAPLAGEVRRCLSVSQQPSQATASSPGDRRSASWLALEAARALADQRWRCCGWSGSCAGDSLRERGVTAGSLPIRTTFMISLKYLSWVLGAVWSELDAFVRIGAAPPASTLLGSEWSPSSQPSCPQGQDHRPWGICMSSSLPGRSSRLTGRGLVPLLTSF